MDLHLSPEEPTAEERHAVDTVLGPATSVWSGRGRGDASADLHAGSGGRPSRRDLLLPALHAVHDRLGWISPGAVNELARRLQVAPAEVFGVASFYDGFALEPRPWPRRRVCVDVSCRLAAGGDVTVPDGDEPSPCLGLCDRAPASQVVGPRGDAATRPLGVPQAGDPALVLLRRVGVVDPTSPDDYRAAGGYRALRRAVEIGPQGVLRALGESGLVGRGGAAFPVGRKWAAVAGQPARPHELVANADESEPGTFKDRVILEGDPFSLIEAMTIAGFTVGASRGFLYLRGEYDQAWRTIDAALSAARARGLLGGDVLGLGFPFDVDVRRGAGAYICGEETAIFNSIEGHRGEPRAKPPFPVDVGLFGRPTLVNNVETLVNVLPILVDGAAGYAAVGTTGSSGTKLFSVSGSVARPGTYEVPFGTTLGELLALAGGPTGSLRAVLLGGAAGSFVGADQLDLPLTFEATRAAGASLGSGAVIVIDESADLEGLLVRIAGFFRHESCGQCVPCRVGTVRQEEILVRWRAGQRRAHDVELLADIGAAMRDASICGLGQTAANAVDSAIRTLGGFS